MKKNYITPILCYCVISESDMLCASDGGLQLNNTEDVFATNTQTDGDDGTDTYVRAQNSWDIDW